MDLQEIANRVATMPLLAVDTETRDPNLTTKGPGFVRGDAEVVGISLAWPTCDGPHHPAALSSANAPDRSMQAGRDIGSVYLPIAHEGGGNLDKDQVLVLLSEVFRRRNKKWPVVMANAAYDLEALKFHGVQFPGPVYDVQIAEALLDENRKSYKLEVLMQHYLGDRKLTDTLTQTVVEKLGVKKEKAMGHIWRLPAEDVAEYACADAAGTLGVWQKQELLIVEQDLCRVWQLECDLVPVLHAMRWHGVRINVEGAELFAEAMTRALTSHRAELWRLSGEEGVEIWAGASVAAAAKRAGAPPLVPEGDKESFTSPVMEKCIHPFFVNLVAARRVDKAITYVESLLDYQVNGRVHCQYHQTRARTGRLSASNPNLQQVPARYEELAKPIRQLFLPEEGELWCSNDYSQAEPRITVHYAHAMGLQGADAARQRYIDDPATDYHQMVAAMCGIERFPAKTLNLGLAYGMGKKKMAAALGLSIEEAEPLFNQYHAGVPFVKLLSVRCTAVASQRGYVRTITGRRRRFDRFGPRYWKEGDGSPLPFDEAKEKWGPNVQRYFIHKAMNALVQGSAADILKTAMVALYKEGILPLMSIHDDLPCSIGTSTEDRMRQAFDGAKPLLEKVNVIKHLMETCLPLSVPHLVVPAIGPTWGDAK